MKKSTQLNKYQSIYKSMNKNALLIFLPVLASLWFLITVIWGGSIYGNYSHISQFISELGATGSPISVYVNYFGFIPTQLFILIFIFLSAIKIPKTKPNIIGLILLCVYTLSLTVAAIFPCDFECRPQTATISHKIHILSAIPAYLSGAFAILILSLGLKEWAVSKTFKNIGLVLAAVILICFVNLDDSSKSVGLVQRLLEASIFFWLILFAIHVKTYLKS